MKTYALTPRKAFGLLAFVLVISLLALIAYLIYHVGQKDSLIVYGTGEIVQGLEPVFAIEGPGSGDEPLFDRPLGAAWGPDGRIYVVDSGHDRICVFDEDGGFLFEFGGTGVTKPRGASDIVWEGGLFDFPLGIDVDENGDIYVADFRNDQIQVFDSEGVFQHAFPPYDEPTGQGSSGIGGGIAVTDVAVAGDRVVATDSYQVLVFDTEGELLTQFGKPGREDGDLDHPNGVAIDDDGNIYVADSNHGRIVAFTPEGDVLWTLGRIPEDLSDTEPRDFGLPRGIAVMEDSTLLVIDTFDFELKRVSVEGKLLATYGERGTEIGQFNFPNDVDVLGGLVLVADKENDRVQVLRLE